MNIYHYHPHTGEYVAQGVADADPTQPGAWLIPAEATAVAPPATSQGQAPVFKDGGWLVVADHRGETWWSVDGTPTVITKLGDPADDGLLAAKPYIPPTMEDYRRSIQALVDSAAHVRQYDDGISCASYKDSTNAAWAAEAAAFIVWRDAVWVYAFAELAKVQAGQRTQPTISDFLEELPTVAWPE